MSKAINAAIKRATLRARSITSDTKRHAKSATTLAMRLVEKHLTALNLAPDIRLDDSGWMVEVVGNCATRTLVLAVFLRLGFKPAFEPKDGESYYSTWMRNGAEHIWFSFSNNACERVKVGTKMVEQDVYETRCTD